MTRLAALKAAAEAVRTPGPWGTYAHTYVGARVGEHIGAFVCHANDSDDAEYIALCSPDTILALVACAEALQTIRYNHSFHDAPRDALTVKQCDAALAALEQA